VWFGEMPLQMERIYEALDRCATFMSIGTSGNVYPAAGFVAHVSAGRGGINRSAHTVELNMEPSEGASLFAETHYGPATTLVTAYVDGVLNGL
jgi:NAD-dependent deacetylase